MDNWKQLLPKDINITQLSFEECRNFKQFYDILTQDVSGPYGFQIFHKLLYHLLFFALCCIDEQKFPTLNKAWDELSLLFDTPEYDNNWLLYCWLFCDFPLDLKNNKVLIEYFAEFVISSNTLTHDYVIHFQQFYAIMKQSRLGLYQEVLSTSKITKFRELISEKVISTVRSVPNYESGEIFLTRIVSYLGDNFQIHNPQCYPSDFRQQIIDMVNRKMFLISESNNHIQDYESFMKLAGPYWMSCTHPNQSIPILSPDHYKVYYSH